MRNKEFNDLLRAAPVPERTEAYWEQFPGRVMARLEISSPANCSAAASPEPCQVNWLLAFRRPAMALGTVVLCLALGFWFGFARGRGSGVAVQRELAEARKCYYEVEALFPGQVQAIIFDDSGARLALAETANVPSSPPVYLKISGPKGSQRVVTFSGQQIQVNGDVCEVLINHDGEVMLIGRHIIWSQSQTIGRAGAYRIEARALGTS